MYLKIMGDENAPDSDPRKTFHIYEVTGAEFYRDEDGNARVYVDRPAGEIEGSYDLPVTGNAYLMNFEGKTIASMGSARLPRQIDLPESHPNYNPGRVKPEDLEAGHVCEVAV